MACVQANFPVLLEGPPAVGKTALISFLMTQPGGRPDRELLRINNSDATTLQDYVGSFLPIDGEFVFKNGPLTRAVLDGHWFLADEMNLADPAILNFINPLLEGRDQLQIPGTRKPVQRHPDFRFFATQNDVSLGGRNRLPDSMRNRFLEVPVAEFI